jgi:hypothetical protein
MKPATGIAAPWIARASSEVRKTMTLARSTGRTHRAGSASGIAARLSGVSIVVGSTQLTFTLRSRSSDAIDSVRRTTAALLAT